MTDPSDLERSCTAQRRTGQFCGRPSISPDAPFPICFKHAARLIGFVEAEFGKHLQTLTSDQLDTVLSRVRGIEAVSVAMEMYPAPPESIRDVRSHVYYVRVGDLIKIGYTTNLGARVGSYPPGSQLLATERGGVDLERARHGQFDDYRFARNEWYHPHPKLLAHIDTLRRAAGSA